MASKMMKQLEDLMKRDADKPERTADQTFAMRTFWRAIKTASKKAEVGIFQRMGNLTEAITIIPRIPVDVNVTEKCTAEMKSYLLGLQRVSMCSTVIEIDAVLQDFDLSLINIDTKTLRKSRKALLCGASEKCRDLWKTKPVIAAVGEVD